jgi:cation:H+ antiporter
MFTASVLLIVGLVVLVIAGDIMVRGAAALARHWGVPALIVGLTIVAFGTSAPEMVVGVQAALIGQGDLAAGNVVGSNIANVLFGGIIAYLFFMFRLAKAGADDPILEEMTEIDEGRDGLPTNTIKSLVYVVLGVAGLVLGGNLIVDNAVFIAAGFGVSATIIGLTIVAVGTSLPEIATVVVATYRGHPEVAIGNVLGSNVFNVFAVMGASALAGPIMIDKSLMRFDFWVMLLSSLVLLLYVLRRQPIGRKTGAIFTLAYIAYLLVVIFISPALSR